MTDFIVGDSTMHKRFALTLIALIVPASSAWAGADEIFGNWARDDGAARVRVAACGGNICATNTWIKDPSRQNEKIGDRLIFTIKAESDEWSGSAYDPQRKLKFSAKLKAAGDNMVTTGCMLGGLVCRSTRWTKN
jgi:uncharacterized protein (DUF2147 family)